MRVIWASVQKEMLAFGRIYTEEKSCMTSVTISCRSCKLNMQKKHLLSMWQLNVGGQFTQNLKTHNKITHN